MKKICNSCEEPKDIDNFYNTSNGRGLYGKTSVCKKCCSEKSKTYREKNEKNIKDKRKIIYNDPEKRRKIREYQKNYYDENRDVLLPKSLKRQKKYKDKRNKRHRMRYKNDVGYKLKHNIKRSILKALKGETKGSKTLEILGCTIEEFKNYIECQWEVWMNWENYGKYKTGCENYGWDLDHKKPISIGKTYDEIIKLNFYKNFQPLCSYKNRYIKRDNYEF